MKYATIVVLTIIIVLAVFYFLFINTGDEYLTQVNLIYQIYETQTGWVMLVSAAVGMILMLPFIAFVEIKYRTRMRQLRKENQSLNQNITNLQNLPIEDTHEDIFRE